MAAILHPKETKKRIVGYGIRKRRVKRKYLDAITRIIEQEKTNDW